MSEEAGEITLLYLSEAQNMSFDAEYHDAPDFENKIFGIDARFPDGPQYLLDIGGGNGKFIDLLLNRYNKAEGWIVDVSNELLKLNTISDRKHIIHGSADDIPELVGGQKFDVVTINWVLHHLVGRSHRASVANATNLLRIAKNLLTPRGVIVVAETMYDGYFGSNIPSRLIFAITSLTNPTIAKVARRYFNTAGIGVCFQSEKGWRTIISSARLRICHEFSGGRWRPNRPQRLFFPFLFLRARINKHFFMLAE